MRAIWDGPAWLYQRYSAFWQRGVLAAGWAALFVLVDRGSGGFAVEWRVVLAACIGLGGMWRPPVGYALLIAAVAYPLYLISVYVMALALAVLILSAPVAVRSMPQTLLVLIAPVFAPVGLLPVTPLLAGLWWGETVGAVVGGLAALWLKIVAAMSGVSPELWSLTGWMLGMAPVQARFHGANSLQTLVRIVEPFSGDSLILLLHLLQVFAWAAAGFVVGLVAHHLRAGQSRAAILSVGPGLVLIWAGYVAVPTWLGLEGPRWLEPRHLPAQVLLAGLVVWLIDAGVRYLERPLVGRRSVGAQVSGRSREQKRDTQKTKNVHDDQDIIMIELD